MAKTLSCSVALGFGAYCCAVAAFQVKHPSIGLVGHVCEYHVNHAKVHPAPTAASNYIVDANESIPLGWLKPLEQPKDDQAETETELPPTPDTDVPVCSIRHEHRGDDRRAVRRVISQGVFRGYVCAFHTLNARLTKNQFLMHSPKNELGREFLWNVNCARCGSRITDDAATLSFCDKCYRGNVTTTTAATGTTNEGASGSGFWGVAVQSNNTSESTASMTTITNGTGIALTPPSTPPAPAQPPSPAKGTTLATVLTADAQDAAWRLAGSQFIKLTRDPLVGLLSRHLGPDDEALRGRIAAFLQTEIGTALLASILSAGVSTLPVSVAGETPQRLARELRVRAMADAGDVVAELLMGPLRQVVSLYLQDIQPAGPAAIEAGGIRPIVTVAERVESEVSR